MRERNDARGEMHVGQRQRRLATAKLYGANLVREVQMRVTHAADAVRVPVVCDDFVAVWITKDVRIRGRDGFELPSVSGGWLKREFVSNAETQVVTPINGSQSRHPTERRKHNPS